MLLYIRLKTESKNLKKKFKINNKTQIIIYHSRFKNQIPQKIKITTQIF